MLSLSLFKDEKTSSLKTIIIFAFHIEKNIKAKLIVVLYMYDYKKEEGMKKKKKKYSREINKKMEKNIHHGKIHPHSNEKEERKNKVVKHFMIACCSLLFISDLFLF